MTKQRRRISTIPGIVLLALCAPIILHAADSIPPTAPSNLVATVATCGHVNLSWTASADEEGGSGLYAYIIRRSEGGRLSGEVTIRASRTTFSDTNQVTSSTALTYTVIAVDHAGNQSIASNSETVTIPPCSGLSGSPIAGDFGGELEVSIEDYPGGSSRTHYVLKTDKQRLPLRFAGNSPEHLMSAHAHVHGVWADGVLKVESGDSDLEILALDPSGASTSSTTSTTTSTTNTLGEQKTLVMLVNFQDKVVQPWTFDQVRTVFSTVSNFFLENSYQQTWLTTSLVGWYTLPISSTTCDNLSIASYAKSAATAANVNLSAYTHYVYVFPTISCQWVGTSTVGGNPTEAWINNELRLDVVAHEMGHNFGLHHSHSLVCNNTGDTSGTAAGPYCFSLEYGDGVDTMGWSHEGAHYNAFMKEFLGWLNKGVSPPITTVQASGTYVLDPYELTGSNPKALKILKGIDPATGLKIWYYVEYRQVAGFDSYLADAGSLVMDAGNILNGVLIHTGSPDDSSNTSVLLDMTPGTYQLYAHDPALDVGKSFSDSAAGVTITPQWVNNSSAGVSVSFSQQQSSCVHANPVVTVSPSSQSGQPGSSLSYSVSVTNKDSSGCSGSTFGLQASVPSGWIAGFALSGLTLSPGASASTTLTVTSPVTGTAGSYNIGVTVSSGSYAASATATDSITSTPTSSLTTTVTTDKSTYATGDTVMISDVTTMGSQPVANASVSITITKPNGVQVFQSGMTNNSGAVTTKLRLNRQKDPKGTYQVVATVTSNGTSAQANKNFTVQ